MKLLKEDSIKLGTLELPYKLFVLDNGLHLLTHKDNSNPLVHVDVTYHVGSAREKPGKTGLAHLFEHMMFEGSENVGPGEHFRQVTAAGGSLNGSTNADRTNYFQTLPKEHLQTALWLESDRMGFLLNALTEEKFKAQKNTVLNESVQRYDNRPYGKVREQLHELLFDAGHPYSWQTIGYEEDIKNFKLDDLKNFFSTWYYPENALLTVGGDFEEEELHSWVKDYFGKLQNHSVPKTDAPQHQALKESRYGISEDHVRFPLLSLAFPTVPNMHKDEVALDCLTEIIGGNVHSVLYQKFEKTGKAVSVHASHPCMELSGYLQVQWLAFPDNKLKDAYESVLDTLNNLDLKKDFADALQRFKESHKAQLIRSSEKLSGRISRLAHYQTFGKTPDALQKYWEHLESLSVEKIEDVYHKYIFNKAHACLCVVPEGKKNMAVQNEQYQKQAPEKASDVSEPEHQLTNENEDFRKFPPLVTAGNFSSALDFQILNFKNGAKSISHSKDSVPMIYANLSLAGGQLLHSYYDEKDGLGYLTSRLQRESTKKHSSEEINDIFDKAGAVFNTSASARFLNAGLSVPAENFRNVWPFYVERIQEPAFKKEEFERVKKQQQELVANQDNDVNAIASRVFNRVVYGEEHVLGTSIYGTKKSVKNIKFEDVINFYEKSFVGPDAIFSVAGKLNAQEQKQISEFPETFNSFRYGKTEDQAKASKQTVIYFVHVPFARQASIQITHPSLSYDATGSFFKSNLANFPLGGAFNSRLNFNLREEKGWTYGIQSYFTGGKVNGHFIVNAQVEQKHLPAAVKEIMREIKNYKRDGVKPSELDFIRKAFLSREALKQETLKQKLDELHRIAYFDLPENYGQTQKDIIRHITVEELSNLMHELLLPGRSKIVVVANEKDFEQPLESCGYPIVRLDMWGNEV